MKGKSPRDPEPRLDSVFQPSASLTPEIVVTGPEANPDGSWVLTVEEEKAEEMREFLRCNGIEAREQPQPGGRINFICGARQ